MTISIETCPGRNCRKHYAARYVFVHPLYSKCKSANDIAIIELDGEATGVSPICLAEQSEKISGSAWTFGVKMDGMFVPVLVTFVSYHIEESRASKC
ncbi:hypothetical protein ANCCAN_25741 [Ancylostoma caninum]|uniref:Peptidase S1 domain-containing protein n=1 Tax=Ancylostoma caninum TaxID=29170 RepID=A0A368FCG5_ANCCA|nr:hypothetical protein ANCCAN_25741 [Ancylostoma caninum]